MPAPSQTECTKIALWQITAMIVKTIKTRIFLPPHDDLLSLIREEFITHKPKERSVIVITSKIVSIWQGRCVPINGPITKDELIKKEAELYLSRSKVPKDYVMLTMKNNIMIPSAGIDESNGAGYYILWPEKPFSAAKTIYDFIAEEFKPAEFGVIISDSHTVPLRWGTMGIAISFWGFYPLKDYRGEEDIFKRKLRFSQLNIADALASTAVLAMGEGNEQTPIAIIENVPQIKFGDFDFLKENPLEIERENDIYGPLLNAIEWERGEG